MRITRDVIYDLLPAYFAGEISADTRALIEEYFTTDPEFGRMAERFRQLHEDTVGKETLDEGEAERRLFDRAKTRFVRRQATMMWAMGAAFAFATTFVASMLTGSTDLRHPGIVIGLVFTWVAAATWMSSRRART